jgi:Ca2+-binding EF-hand superfamily protein
MWRVVTSTIAALALFASTAAAQAPCTTDANRVVSEVYRHILERGVDPGAQNWVQRLANGQMTVKELVRQVAKSQEHMQRFGQTESGEGQPFERAVARMYRHVLGRQADNNGQRSWTNTAQQRGLAAVVDGLIDSAEYNNKFGDWGVPGSGGVTFCANNSNNSNTSSSAQPLDNQRFRAMDVNRDGVIARREWQGSNQSFRVHDWNNDGVLSGDEVATGRFRQGRNADFEDFDRAEEFEFLDANNNGRIEEREWHASVRAFDQLDRNNDGVLNRAEFVRAGATAGTAATAGQTVAVAADRQWSDTGINVRAGETITINADGRIRLARDSRDFVTAAGAETRVADATMPNAPIGGLVARFGDSAPVFVGQSRTFRAPRAGRLYLGVNDSYFDDNTGQFNARVDVN